MENKDLKTLGLFGIVGYVLSLPILIWKSSRIGRIVFVFLMLWVGLFGIEKVSGYVLNLRAKFMLQQRLEPALQGIEKLQDAIRASQVQVATINELIQADSQERIEKHVTHVLNGVQDRFTILNQQLDEIESAVQVIRDIERQAIKERIIDLREQVKVYKRSIDEKEIRLACENVIDQLSLLTDVEKGRFMDDLRELGFGVEKQRDEVYRVYSGDWGYASGGTVSFVGGEKSTIDNNRVIRNNNPALRALGIW